MLIIEENNLGDKSTSQSKRNYEQQAFYSSTGRGQGRGQSHGGQSAGRSTNQNQQLYDLQQQQNTGGRGHFRGRGSARGHGYQRQHNDVICHYCGKPGHMQASYYKK